MMANNIGSDGAMFRFIASAVNLSRLNKRVVLMLVDAALCVIAVLLAFSLRLGYWELATDRVIAFSVVALALWATIYSLTGVYRSIVRFSGGRTMINLGLATLAYAVPLNIIFLVIGMGMVPRTISLIQPMVFFVLLAMSRLVARYVLFDLMNQRSFRGPCRNVLIYGAGGSGQQLAMSIQHEPGMVLRGYIDDDMRLDGQRLDGVPVYDAADIGAVIRRTSATDVLLAMPGLTRSRQTNIVERLQQYPLRVRTLPNVAQIVDGRVSVSDLREIQVEELLGRDPVAPNQLLLGRTIIGKTVMVTGAGGSIGSELCRQIAALGPKRLILLEMTEHALYNIDQELYEARALGQISGQIELVAELANLIDEQSVARIFRRWRPDTVFHAAAYKHVPLVEGNPLWGIKNNVVGTLNAARLAQDVGTANFILVSTDKAVRPTNLMGASKRVCELVLQAMADARRGHTRFAMVRFGNVLGSSGSVVPRFKAQIRDGGPLTLTHRDINRYFMTIPEAAQLVIQAGAMAQGGEVYVLDMGEPVRIIDLARTMIRLSGRTVRDEANPDGDIEIVEIGLRPGEKLFEELLIGDNPEATNHPRIMRAREAYLGLDALMVQIAALSACLDGGDTAGAIAIVRTLVPGYTSPAMVETADLSATVG